MIFDAFFPAAIAHGRPMHERDLGGGDSLRWPDLDPDAIESISRHLRFEGFALRAMPVDRIVEAISAAAVQIGEDRSELGALARRLLPRTTGYSEAMIDLVVQRMAADWSRRALERLLQSELGGPARLDGFARDPAGRRTRAFGPELATHIFSGNVPGVAVTSLVRALLVKAPSFGKTARDEPVLPILFARALAAADPDIAAAITLTYWPGGDAPAERAAFAAADTIIVYGGADVIDAARAHARPDQRLVLHGPRFSIAVLGPDALDPDHAWDLALATATFDQQGCVSPHIAYVASAEPGAALRFAEMVAGGLAQLQSDLPRGSLSTEEAVALNAARARAEFRAIAGARVVVSASDDTAFTVVFDEDPEFTPSCLNRFLYIKPVDSTLQLAHILRPFGHQLQSVGHAGFDEKQTAELAFQLGSIGATRFTSLSALPWPPPDWHHDGEGPLRELIRWVDWE